MERSVHGIHDLACACRVGVAMCKMGLTEKHDLCPLTVDDGGKQVAGSPRMRRRFPCDRRIIGAGSCLAIEEFEWPVDIACAVG